MFKKQKLISLLFASSLLLTACGIADNQAGSGGSDSFSSAETESQVAELDSSAAESSSQSSVENPETGSGEASGDIVPGGSTELNYEEAAKIEKAKEKITELTGYREGEGYLFFIDGVEGDIVQLNVREDGEETASAIGFYRYDDSTGNVQELNIVTNEYEDFPANE